MRGRQCPARVKCTRVGRVRQALNEIVKLDKNKYENNTINYLISVQTTKVLTIKIERQR